MQILKSPLGIQSPLLGIGASLSPPSLLLQKSSFPALLHGLIKPSTPLESSFSLSRYDFSQLSDGQVTEWNANKPHFEIHSFPQNNTIEVGKFKNNQLAKSSIKRGVTNTDSQSTDELTLQKQSKANKKQTKSKNNQKQSKSKKIASASVSVEKVSQSLKQINSHDSIDSSEKISVNNALGDMTRELVGEFLESSHSTLQQRQTVLRNPVDSEFPSVASSAPVMPLQELESDVTPTWEQNILTPHPVVVESPQLVESKTTSGDTTPIQASPQHRELLNLTSTSTPPQNIFPQHPVVVESPQFVESKTTSGDTTPIHASPQHRELLNLTSTSTPPQNILTQHPIVVESPQFVESKTTSGDTTPIQASPQHPQLPNIIPPVLDGSSTLTPPQNFVTTPIHVSPQHRQFPNLTPTPTSLQNIVSNNPVNVEYPEFMESKTASGDTTPIQASPQHPQLPNIIPPILDSSSTLTPPPNIFPQHPVVAESPQLVESKTKSGDTTPIPASPQHRELLNLTSTSTPPQNIFPQHPVVVESPQFVESKTTSSDTTPIQASPQHPQLPNIIPPVLDGSSTLTPPQNFVTTPIHVSPQHRQFPNLTPTPTSLQNIVSNNPVNVEYPEFMESKTASGDTTPIQASPQHPQLPNIIPPVLDSSSTLTPPPNIFPQHPVVAESPQLVESKTTSNDTIPIQASPQHRELLNLTSTSTPPQNIFPQHPVVVESPQLMESKTASGDTTPIPASPQHPQLPNIIPPILDSSSTLTPPQNFVTTPIHVSPQHRQFPNLTPTPTSLQNIVSNNPVNVEYPEFMESKTASGDTTPIQASPQHPQLPNIIPPVLDGSSTLTPPPNIFPQHPVVAESPQLVESKTTSNDTIPIQASPQHRELLNLTSTSTPPQNILKQHPVVVESPQFVESKTTSGDTTPIPASPQHPQLPNIIPPVLDSSSTLTPPQNLLTQHPVVVESPQFVESKTTSGDTTAIQASSQHRELLNLTSTSTPPQNILTQHPVVVESPQLVESKTKSGDTIPIQASPEYTQLPNIIPPVLDGSSTLTPPQNILTQHPVVVESPQFVESKTTSGDTTPIQASPEYTQLPNIILPILDSDRTLTPPQNIFPQHPVVVESPQFVESKTTSGDTTPIQASPQHRELLNLTSTSTPPQNIFPQHPVVVESPQFVELKTTSGDTTPIQASPQHRELLNLTSTSTPPQNLLTPHPVVEESPQFVESKTTSGDTTPIQASPQHRELLNLTSTSTPPQNIFPQHPVVVESPQFVESKTTSGDTTPIQASPQHRELLNLTSTSTPPQNIFPQHPVVVESPQFVESKTTSGDTTPIQASSQHRELLNLTSTSTPPQNILTQHPVVVESPQLVESKTTSGDTTPIQASPQHPQLPNIIPPVVDGSSTLTPPQNLLTQHPVVVESPQFVESKTTSGDATPIQASPQHPQLPNIIPPVLDGDRTDILPQDIDLATTSNQVLQTTFKLDDGFNGSTHLQAEAFQKSVQSPPSLINTSNNTSVLNITSDLGVQPTASESLPAVPNSLAYSEVNVNGKNSSNTVDGEMRSHISTSEPGEAVRTINAFINDSTEIKEDLPPPQGYAVGGHVTASNITGTPKVAQSDTVPAMLTPGEFVVNSKDAQKNLNLLKHINSSGIVPDHILTSPPSINKSEEQADAAAVKTSTKVESSKDFPVQRKSSDERVPGTLSSLVSSSPLLKNEKQGLMTLNSLQSNSSEKKTTQLNESSSHYSSTPLIFRKRISTTDSSSYSSNSPSQWTRIEELVNGSNRTESSQYGFEHQNSASTKWRSPKSSTQNLLQLKSSANGKSANAPDTFTPLQPVTEIIERPSSEPTDTNSDDLETLAREIYHRLRQRLELERERHGSYSGRLPW